MAGQYVGGKLTDRIPVERGLVVIFAILASLVLVFIPVSTLGLVPLLLLCGLLGFFLFAIQPFYQVAVALYTPADTRGLSYGYVYLAEFGFGATSVAIGGFLLGAYPLGVFFAVLSVFAAVGAILAFILLVGHDGIDIFPDTEREPSD
jgi:predicted MFS family arabinose efflux permease